MIQAYPPPPLDEALKAARLNIRDALKKNGKYSHNIISNSLRLLASYHGFEEANKLVDEFKLTEKLGIEKRKK